MLGVIQLPEGRDLLAAHKELSPDLLNLEVLLKELGEVELFVVLRPFSKVAL